MEKIVITVLFLFTFNHISNAKIPRLDLKIVGGRNASILDFPYQISLRKFNQHICGGSIFHSSYVLSAAHCIAGGIASQYSIRAGSNHVNQGGQRVKICTIRTHEKYSSTTLDNDIAVLKLCSPLTFSDKILPIALPESNEELAAGTSALVSGWGFQNEDGVVSTVLKQVEVPIISHSICKNAYAADAVVTQNMICAGFTAKGGKDACQGDSGGPLRANGKLMGIISWGYGCARPNYPGVYTKVSNYRKWIKTISNY